jgi:hypothetical protein
MRQHTPIRRHTEAEEAAHLEVDLHVPHREAALYGGQQKRMRNHDFSIALGSLRVHVPFRQERKQSQRGGSGRGSANVFFAVFFPVFAPPNFLLGTRRMDALPSKRSKAAVKLSSAFCVSIRTFVPVKQGSSVPVELSGESLEFGSVCGTQPVSICTFVPVKQVLSYQ